MHLRSKKNSYCSSKNSFSRKALKIVALLFPGATCCSLASLTLLGAPWHSLAFASTPWRSPTLLSARSKQVLTQMRLRSKKILISHQKKFLSLKKLRYCCFTGSWCSLVLPAVLDAPWLFLAFPGARRHSLALPDIPERRIKNNILFKISLQKI